MSNVANAVTKIAHKPIGLVALPFVFIDAIAAYVIVEGEFALETRGFLGYGFMVFSFCVAFMFYLLVSRHHGKLYAPSDFKDENNFIKYSNNKLEDLPQLNKLEDLPDKSNQQK